MAVMPVDAATAIPLPGSPGVMQIVEDEPAAIRDIYEAFVGGKTARQIANALNKRGVKPPRASGGMRGP